MKRRRARRQCAILVLVAGIAAPVCASLAWAPPILLVWNASASAPIGLYRIFPDARIRRGDMVVAWTPAPARALAARRRYVPANVPLVKRVAATFPARVCANGPRIFVDGAAVATRKRRDAAARPMPWWSGCVELGRHDYLLLMDSVSSFDGRYFGPTRETDLVGRAELVWAR